MHIREESFTKSPLSSGVCRSSGNSQSLEDKSRGGEGFYQGVQDPLSRILFAALLAAPNWGLIHNPSFITSLHSSYNESASRTKALIFWHLPSSTILTISISSSSLAFPMPFCCRERDFTKLPSPRILCGDSTPSLSFLHHLYWPHMS